MRDRSATSSSRLSVGDGAGENGHSGPIGGGDEGRCAVVDTAGKAVVGPHDDGDDGCAEARNAGGPPTNTEVSQSGALKSLRM